VTRPATYRSEMVSWPGASELSLLQSESESGPGSRVPRQRIVVEVDCNMAAAAGTRSEEGEGRGSARCPAAAGQHPTVVRHGAPAAVPESWSALAFINLDDMVRTMPP
jgi:hypothetical protein